MSYRSKRTWTEKEALFLKEHRFSKGGGEIGSILSRTRPSVYNAICAKIWEKFTPKEVREKDPIKPSHIIKVVLSVQRKYGHYSINEKLIEVSKLFQKP